MVFTHVLLTGASSGIGRAFAVALAGPGVTLHLGGRDEGRLQAVAALCKAKGASAHPRIVSVIDAAAMSDWIEQAGPLDLVIANAGISGGTGGKGGGTLENEAQTRAIFATNLDGMLNTVLPAMAVMVLQPPDSRGVRGRIAVVASLAAFLPGPSAPAYHASKAAVDYWVVGTSAAARRQGIRMTSLCPGFIETPMTAGNAFPMPGIMSAERAATLMLRAIRLDMTRYAFPGWVAAGARLSALLPAEWRDAVAKRFPGKGTM
jgi:NAD(P)-dependent dehydrogenase (short-subunit alcohol dehydrogenase family)